MKFWEIKRQNTHPWNAQKHVPFSNLNDPTK